MAKEGKSLSADEAKEKLQAAKEKLMVAKDAMAAFCKENKLKKSDDYSQHDDAKIAKKWSKLKAEIDEKEARVEKYKAAVKDAKKSSGGGAKKAKYVYPKEVKTSADKKKYRTDIRSKAKKAGVTVDEYLADPDKYKDLVEKKPKKKAKEEKSEKAPKKKAKEEKSEKKAKKKVKKEAVEAEAATADAGSED